MIKSFNIVNGKNYKDAVLFLEKLFLLLIISLIIYSFFFTIPSDSNSIGIASDKLNIGDREFYIHDAGARSLEFVKEGANGFSYGYPEEGYQGNFLYPYILNTVKNFTSIFGQSSTSRFWNTCVILITSVQSIITLRLLKLSSSILFSEKVSFLSCLLFIINPYTYYFSLSGGITNYIVLGVSLVLYLFSRQFILKNTNTNLNYLFISFSCIFLACLKPSSGIFSLSVILLLLLNLFISNKNNINQNFIPIAFLAFSFFISFYNVYQTTTYIATNLNEFSIEVGSFFGYPRESLRSTIESLDYSIVARIKSYFYVFLWKISDFISGISDIRDTHYIFSDNTSKDTFPFLIRVFTGLFYFYPLNIFMFISLLINRRFLFKSKIWIIILSSLIPISPHILGYANSRYWVCFYLPCLIFASKFIIDIFELSNTSALSPESNDK